MYWLSSLDADLIDQFLLNLILFDFVLIWQEKLKTTTSSLQLSEAENELQSECNRNPLSKALLLMHMAGQAVRSKSHVGTERQTQLLQACCFTRIYFSLFSYIALSRHSYSRSCITQSRFCVTHVCFIDFVTHFCVMSYISLSTSRNIQHILLLLCHIFYYTFLPLYQTFSFLHYAFLLLKLYVTHGSYLSMYNSSCTCHTLLL